jgi:hypothetical protein
MSQSRKEHLKMTESGTADSRWQGLHKVGGLAALVIALLLVGEIVVYTALPRPASAMEHFALFHDSWLFGLLTMDLLGMISYLLFVPVILALYMALRAASASLALVATVFFFVGIADFFATNTAFPVLSLSRQYAAATTEAERALFLAAGQTMFTLFNENAFLVSYVIVSAAWTMIACLMLRSRVFARTTALAGMLAGATGIIAVVLEHISSGLLAIAIAFYFAAVVFLLVWVILVGRRLYRLGTTGRVARTS